MSRVLNPLILGGMRRQLRKDATEAEKVFWERVRNHRFDGLKFYRQYGIDGYIVDFCCLSKMLVIEIDGEYHDEADQLKEDAIREKNLRMRGFHVMRFTNSEIMIGVEDALGKIRKELLI